MTLTYSQQVNWWTVHEYVIPVLDRVKAWPMAGTPAWCLLDDGDPAKVAAVYDAARHHILRVETAQEALREAGEAISAAADWAAVARDVRNREEFYASRPWMKRRAS